MRDTADSGYGAGERRILQGKGRAPYRSCEQCSGERSRSDWTGAWGITGLQWIREQGGAGDLRFAVVAGDAACDLQRRAEMIGARMDSE